MYPGIFCCGMDGVGVELLSAYQCVVSHYVQLHVFGCTPAVPFNLTAKTKADGNMVMHGTSLLLVCYIIQYTILYYTILYYTILHDATLYYTILPGVRPVFSGTE